MMRYDDVRGWSDRNLAAGHLGACEGRRRARVALYEAAIRERGGDPVPWTLEHLRWPAWALPEAERVLAR